MFLVAGHPVMRGREAFAASFKKAIQQFRIEFSSSDIQELRTIDGFAFCRNQLTVGMTPISQGKSMRHSGSVLTIFRRTEDGSRFFIATLTFCPQASRCYRKYSRRQ